MYTRDGRNSRVTAPFANMYQDLLQSVPLTCKSSRGEILLFTEKIKRKSKFFWLLSPGRVSGAVCVIAAATCSHLAYASSEDQNMLTLFRRIDSLPSVKIHHPANWLEQMVNEFTEKALAYGDFERAKTNAKRFIIDYCKKYNNQT